MRQTELEKPILFGVWERKHSAKQGLLSRHRPVWADGVSDPVATEYSLEDSSGNFRAWTALMPHYWASNVGEKLTIYLKATRPELFRKPRVRKVRQPPLRGENGKFIKVEHTESKVSE